MYPNLEAELARRRITREKLADATGHALSTICLKLKGKSPISTKLAKKIQTEILKTRIPLEELFKFVPNKSAKGR